MKRRYLLPRIAALVVLLIWPPTAHAEQRIEWVKTDVADIKVTEQPKSVTVSAKLAPDADLRPETVEVGRYDAEGKLVRSLGAMYDDGTRGDATRNDGIFTAVVQINEPAPAVIIWGVSARYKNSENPVIKPVPRLVVASGETCEEAHSKLSNYLAEGNLAEALKYFPSEADAELLNQIGVDEVKRIGSDFKTGKITMNQERFCEFTFTDSKMGRTSSVTWTQTLLGDWAVAGW